MSTDYKSHELNLFYAGTTGKLVLKDTTGTPNTGLAPSTNVMSLAVDYNGSSDAHALFIPELMIGDSGGYAFSPAYAISNLNTLTASLRADLTSEAKDRKSADTTLTASIAAEAKSRVEADSKHTSDIAQEVYDRGAGDTANFNLINAEVADRKAAITVVSNSAANNAINITAEATRAVGEEKRIEGRVEQELKDRSYFDGILQANIDAENKRALAAELVLTNGLAAESKRALEKEGKLDARIDFLTSNSDPAAIDSLSEIVSQFSTNGMGYAARLTYLEGVISALLNK